MIRWEKETFERFKAEAPEDVIAAVGKGEIDLEGYTCARSTNDKDFTVEAIVSTNIVDRWGEIVEPSGWKLRNYKRNPIVLLNHLDNELPIGRALEVEIRPSGLWGKIQYAVKESPRAAEVWSLVKAEILRAWSPGWWPIKWETIDGKEKGEGPVFNRKGIRFLEQELWEISQVTIPAASNALTLGISKLAIDTASLFGLSLPESTLPGEIGVISRGIRLVSESPDLREAIQEASAGGSIGKIGKSVEDAAQEHGVTAEEEYLASALEEITEKLKGAREAIAALQ